MADPEKITAEQLETWLTPTQALARFPEHWTVGTAIGWIAGRLEGGLIIAAAEGYLGQMMPEAARGIFRIDNILWKHWPSLADEDFWRGGEVTFWKPPRAGFGDPPPKLGRYFGVKFAPDEFPPEPEASHHEQSRPPAPSKGGAPRKAFWDPLWIEMIRRIRAGSLHPKSAAELEGMMETWLEENSFEYGDGTLHKTALNLFKYLQE